MEQEIKIIAISDTHTLLQSEDLQGLPLADIFIHAGDFTMESTPQELEQFREVLQSIEAIPKVVIPGNHESIFNPDIKQHQLTEEQIEYQRNQLKAICHLLEFDLVNIKGINILGISKWPEYFDMYFDFIPHLGTEVIDKYKGKVDVLVTHWPPLGVLDQINKKEQGGSKGLLKFVKAIKPKVHIFGHIHEGYGYKEADGIKFYNVSFLDKHYKVSNKPFLITVPITIGVSSDQTIEDELAIKKKMQKVQPKRKLKIVAISDNHGNYQMLKDYKFPAGDLFIHAGDFTLNSNPQHLEKFREFLKQLPYKHKILVPGNNDFALQPTRQAYRQIIKEFCLRESYWVNNIAQIQKIKQCCTLLNHEEVEIDGIKIFGSPYIESRYTQGFRIDHQDGPKVWSQIPKNIDILVTHMPPFGILDRSNVAKASVGSKPLREVVDVIKPKVHIFGHIHENYGYMEMNQTHFYNVSHFDYWNNPKHEPTVIQIDI